MNKKEMKELAEGVLSLWRRKYEGAIPNAETILKDLGGQLNLFCNEEKIKPSLLGPEIKVYKPYVGQYADNMYCGIMLGLYFLLTEGGTKQVEVDYRGANVNKKDWKLAYNFAKEVIMPEDSVNKAYDDGISFNEMSHYFLTPHAFVIERFEDLGFRIDSF